MNTIFFVEINAEKKISFPVIKPN